MARVEYSIGVLDSLDKIFTGVLIGELRKDNDNFDEKVKTTVICLNRFLSLFQSNIFKDEYAIFYEILSTFGVKSFTSDQLDTIIENNKDLILDSPYVDISKYMTLVNGRQPSSDEIIGAFREDLVSKLVEYSNNYVTENDFISSCRIFIDWFKNWYMFETTQNMTMIMSELGFEERLFHRRSKKLQGLEDAKSYYSRRMAVINELSEENRIREKVVDNDWLEQELMQENVPDKEALMTVGIAEIDGTLGELRRSNIIGILGPPKGGKTRFTNFLVQRALSLGLNVCVWALEGTSSEWIAMQTASYLRRTEGVSYNSKDILQRKYRGDNVRKKQVTSAKIMMAQDKNMGRLSFIEGIAYVEDFLDVLENHYNSKNPFDVVVLDSLVNIQSKNGKGKTERISEAYITFKGFVANRLKRPALAIVPAQLKQDTVDFLRKNPSETIDVTAGGESAETIRTPDEVIGLFSSKEERAAGIMKVYSVASRHSGNFDDFAVRADFQCCHFYSDPSLNS